MKYSWRCKDCGEVLMSNDKGELSSMRRKHKYITDPITKTKMCHMVKTEFKPREKFKFHIKLDRPMVPSFMRPSLYAIRKEMR